MVLEMWVWIVLGRECGWQVGMSIWGQKVNMRQHGGKGHEQVTNGTCDSGAHGRIS